MLGSAADMCEPRSRASGGASFHFYFPYVAKGIPNRRSALIGQLLEFAGLSA